MTDTILLILSVLNLSGGITTTTIEMESMERYEAAKTHVIKDYTKQAKNFASNQVMVVGACITQKIHIKYK
ncbi:MAG TPA: hypothetical protein VJ201_03415 [Candidatus Babeliales bacterium]|nr:hypothetical protein [Candidatus Babeliales bacterium]